MLLVDTVQHVIIGDDELKLGIARARPHSEWLGQLRTLDDLRRAAGALALSHATDGPVDAVSSEDIRKRLSLFNYTLETLTLLLVPMFTTKYEMIVR